MRSSSRGLRHASALAILLSALSSGALAATFTVTNTADTGPGSLREAILGANANVGGDTITFNVSGAGCDGSGLCTITPAAALPFLTDTVSSTDTRSPDPRPTPTRSARATRS